MRAHFALNVGQDYTVTNGIAHHLARNLDFAILAAAEQPIAAGYAVSSNNKSRSYFTIKDIDFLNRKEEWRGLSTIGLAESIVTKNGQTSVEKRYFIKTRTL